MANNQRLTNEELAEIKERVEKATRGATPEWFVDDEYNDTVRCSWSADLIAENIPTEADAIFIAKAREDIPKLLAEVEYRRGKQSELLEYNRYYLAENKRLRAEVEELHEKITEQERLLVGNCREYDKMDGEMYEAYLEIQRGRDGKALSIIEDFGVTYEPTGGGSKAQRWSREKGMLKNAQGKYGNEVLRRFIEICVDEYKAKPQFPYASFTFAYSYMSDRFAKAEREVAKEKERAELAERSGTTEIDDAWF